MASLIDIDSQLTRCMQDLKPLILELEFQEHIEFKLNDKFDCSLLNTFNYPGIYQFEIKRKTYSSIKEWLNKFSLLWEDSLYKKKSVPNLKKKRLSFHTSDKEWVPLYIGKSKCISQRLKTHLTLKLDCPTFALKLMERENLYGHEFRISSIKIAVDNYDLIVPQFENTFRDYINPILGRR